MNKLLVLTEDPREYTPLLRAAGLQQLEILEAGDIRTAAELVVDCNIVLGAPFLVSEILSAASRIEWVQSSWAGIDRLCQPQLRRDYVLTGLKGIFGPLISEYVMTYLFALERNLFDIREDQSRKRWQPGPYRRSKDITLGIIGTGSIGQHVARTARNFGIHVIGLSRSGSACEYFERVYSADTQSDFLTQPDYVVVTLPDTPQTRHFINSDVLDLMKSTAVLINVGRGSAVNEDDLVAALEHGEIGGAVLDVFTTEPLPPESPLWSLHNVYITPHVAAHSFPEDVVEIFTRNYHHFLKGEPLLHVIEFDRGY